MTYINMKERYDFSKGKRGRVLPAKHESVGKTRITIGLDQDIVDRYLERAEKSGGAAGLQQVTESALIRHLENE